jgi:hypothetical protein
VNGVVSFSGGFGYGNANAWYASVGATSDGITYDGVVNKTLRKKAVTHGKQLGANYLIKY